VVARPDCASGMHLDVRTFGPPPLKQMTEDFLRAYKTTVDFWAEDLRMQPRHGRDEGVVGETALPNNGFSNKSPLSHTSAAALVDAR
jgi:hypothetical protein